mmetsp:Transcript_21140/g.44437  ORF Transcript_21140/g.44437 Transcript_21140/m.44437 type:complete len:647 (-) Transcript_21140:261-2201(-)
MPTVSQADLRPTGLRTVFIELLAVELLVALLSDLLRDALSDPVALPLPFVLVLERGVVLALVGSFWKLTDAKGFQIVVRKISAAEYLLAAREALEKAFVASHQSVAEEVDDLEQIAGLCFEAVVGVFGRNRVGREGLGELKVVIGGYHVSDRGGFGVVLAHAPDGFVPVVVDLQLEPELEFLLSAAVADGRLDEGFEYRHRCVGCFRCGRGGELRDHGAVPVHAKLVPHSFLEPSVSLDQLLFSLAHGIVPASVVGAHPVAKLVLDLEDVAGVFLDAHLVRVLVVVKEILSEHDPVAAVVVFREVPGGFESVLVGFDPDIDPRLAGGRHLRRVVAKVGDAVEVVADGFPQKARRRTGACVDTRFVGLGAALSPRNDPYVEIDEGPVAPGDPLDEGSARVSLAGILSALRKARAEHLVGDGAVVGHGRVAGVGAHGGNRNVVQELGTRLGLGEGTEAHNDEFPSIGRNGRFLVQDQLDPGLVDVHRFVELAEGKVVVDRGTALAELRVGLPLFAESVLGPVVGAPSFEGPDADLKVRPVVAMRREQNHVRCDQGTTASAHLDKIGVVANRGFVSTNDACNRIIGSGKRFRHRCSHEHRGHREGEKDRRGRAVVHHRARLRVCLLLVSCEVVDLRFNERVRSCEFVVC